MRTYFFFDNRTDWFYERGWKEKEKHSVRHLLNWFIYSLLAQTIQGTYHYHTNKKPKLLRDKDKKRPRIF